MNLYLPRLGFKTARTVMWQKYNFSLFRYKNSKVFEQKGDLLNFKANIDSMAMLSQAEPS